MFNNKFMKIKRVDPQNLFSLQIWKKKNYLNFVKTIGETIWGTVQSKFAWWLESVWVWCCGVLGNVIEVLLLWLWIVLLWSWLWIVVDWCWGVILLHGSGSKVTVGILREAWVIVSGIVLTIIVVIAFGAELLGLLLVLLLLVLLLLGLLVVLWLLRLSGMWWWGWGYWKMIAGCLETEITFYYVIVGLLLQKSIRLFTFTRNR